MSTTIAAPMFELAASDSSMARWYAWAGLVALTSGTLQSVNVGLSRLKSFAKPPSYCDVAVARPLRKLLRNFSVAPCAESGNTTRMVGVRFGKVSLLNGPYCLIPTQG